MIDLDLHFIILDYLNIYLESGIFFLLAAKSSRIVYEIDNSE